jgi:2-dehydro-3-deoxyphosphogluconate aldolase/(4S)-4-hydroxy-2-oxoglutarate aldolase
MRWTRILRPGGVDACVCSLRAWFGAGIVACGIGSNLVTKQLLDAKDYKGIEDKVRTTVQLVKTIKADLAAKR